MELGSGNAPNFSKLLHPVLQGQQLSHCAGTRISRQSLVTSSYNLCQGGQRGKQESVPCIGILCHPSPLHPEKAERPLSAEIPAWDKDFAALYCCSYPETGFGAHPDTSPSAAPSATWQDQQCQDWGEPQLHSMSGLIPHFPAP